MRLEKMRQEYYFLNYVPNALISMLTEYMDQGKHNQYIMKHIIKEFKSLRLIP